MLPKRFPDRDEIAVVRAEAEQLEAGSTDESRSFRLAGRVMARREMGQITFLDLVDRSGRIQQVYQTAGVPESFLLDEHGIILKRVIGAHDWNSPSNIALIERTLGIEPSDTASASPEEPS